MTPLIKICGITNEADAKVACDLGANFLGLIFVGSSARSVGEEEALRIFKLAKRNRVKVVGVFKDASEGEVARISEKVRFDFVQCHGAETPEFCRALPFSVIKVLEIGLSDTAEKLRSSIFHYADSVQYILFDRPKSRSSDPSFGLEEKWLSHAIDLLSQISIPVPYMFAGGLNADNVSEVIARIQPWVVDVASGVEREAGKKDFSKMEAFFNSVKSFDVNKGVPAK